MALPRARRKPAPIMRIALLGVGGAGSIALLIGYMLGQTPSRDPFSADETHFVEGVQIGTRYKVDYEAWLQTPHDDARDMRGHPEQRCAALYYPFDEIRMAGCLQGINTPKDGFSLPPPR